LHFENLNQELLLPSSDLTLRLTSIRNSFSTQIEEKMQAFKAISRTALRTYSTQTTTDRMTFAVCQWLQFRHCLRTTNT